MIDEVRPHWGLDASGARSEKTGPSITAHALEEMDEDSLTEDDVRQVILDGKLTATLTDDPRGARFVIRATSPDQGFEIEVVCRLLPSGLLRIITV